MVQQRCGGATAPRLAADTRRSRGCVGDEHRLMVGRAPHVRELFCEWARPHAEIGWRQASRAQHTARVCGCACVCVLASERERERERERDACLWNQDETNPPIHANGNFLRLESIM